MLSAKDFNDNTESTVGDVTLRELYIVGRRDPVTSCLIYIYFSDTDRLGFTY